MGLKCCILKETGETCIVEGEWRFVEIFHSIPKGVPEKQMYQIDKIDKKMVLFHKFKVSELSAGNR